MWPWIKRCELRSRVSTTEFHYITHFQFWFKLQQRRLRHDPSFRFEVNVCNVRGCCSEQQYYYRRYAAARTHTRGEEGPSYWDVSLSLSSLAGPIKSFLLLLSPPPSPRGSGVCGNIERCVTIGQSRPRSAGDQCAFEIRRRRRWFSLTEREREQIHRI